MKSLILAAALSAAASAAPAFAAGHGIEVTVKRELLETSAGREKIFREFRDAARRHCRAKGANEEPRTAVSTCTRDYVRLLIDDLGDPRMTPLLEKNWNSYSRAAS